MSPTNKGFSCQFNGGCGFNFKSKTEYLRHVVKHLHSHVHISGSYVVIIGGIRGTTCTEIVEGFREQSKTLTHDLFAFDCLIPQRILTAYNSLKAKNIAPPLQQSFDSTWSYGRKEIRRQPFQENIATFPVYELVLHRFQAQEDELIPAKSSLVNMNDVLPFVDIEHERKLNYEDSSMMKGVNWKEILDNYPSVVDEMSPGEILAHDAAKKSKENSKSKSILVQCSINNRLPNMEKKYSDVKMAPGNLVQKNKFVDRSCLPLGSAGTNLKFPTSVWPTTLAGCKTPSFLYTGYFKDVNKCCGKPNLTAPKPPSAKVVVPATRKRTIQNGFSIPRKGKIIRDENDSSQFYSSAYILEEGLKKKRASGVIYLKPYVCPVPKCGKSYKNANGIKYHAKYGHSARREFPCHCGKLYNTLHSLMAHKKTHSASYFSESSEEGLHSSPDASESDMGETSSGDSGEESCT